MSRTLQLAGQLISRPSLTPDDALCQDIYRRVLGNLDTRLPL